MFVSRSSVFTERTAEALVTGRIQPRTPLDALRWLSGYFAGKHSGI
jgi:hypothetical protein